MATRPYDPGKVIVTFKGIQILGFADGTFVKASRSEAAFKTKVGAYGDVVRTRNRNKMGSVVLTLQQTSLSNDALSAALLNDETSGTGAGTLMIKDLNGTTLFESSVAWVNKMADGEFGDDATNREWTVDCGELKIFNGGTVAL